MGEKTQILMLVLLGTALLLFLAAGIIIALFLAAKRKSESLRTQQKLKSDFETELLRAQLEIREQTFGDIGMEIHDNIGASLSVVKLYLGALDNPADVAVHEKAGKANELLSKTIQDLRTLSHLLNADRLATVGIAHALENECLRINGSGKMKATFALEGARPVVDARAQVILFRMCQEIISNALRHSHAEALAVQVQSTAGELKITLADNGKGFNLSHAGNPSAGGSGLANLHKRAQLVGASLEIQSGARGTTATLSYPIPTNSTAEN